MAMGKGVARGSMVTLDLPADSKSAMNARTCARLDMYARPFIVLISHINPGWTKEKEKKKTPSFTCI
jgi:hypothetical protein